MMLFPTVPHYYWLRLITILVLGPMVVFSMNCSQYPGLENDEASGLAVQASLKSGPGGDGKISFFNLDKENQCGVGPRVRSRIVIDKVLGPQMIFENCQEIPARPLSLEEIGLLPHNLKNLIYQGRVFDRYDKVSVPLASSEYLCRGFEEDSDTEQKQVVDVILKQSASDQPAETATVIIAIYDKYGKYKQTLQSAELKVRQIPTGKKDRVKYVADIHGLYGLMIWIDQSAERTTAKLSLIELPYVGKNLEPGYLDHEFQRQIQNLYCVRHQ